jgi:hypothetical protein
MSTKTLRKRIALVAVAALGAGVLVTSPASADDNGAVGGTNATTAASVMNIATKASITGAAVTSTTFADQRSLGLLANSTTMGNGLTQTATLRSDGAIVVYLTGVTDGASTIVVSGGTIDAYTGDKTIDVNSSKTQLVTVDDSAALKISAAVKPNAGATSMTISYYQAAAATAVNDGSTEVAVAAAIQAGTTSKGTLTSSITVTIATTSVSGIYSPTYSYVKGQTSAAQPTDNVDVANSLFIDNSASAAALISIDLRDAYNVSLDSVGALVVTGTNGAGIKYNSSYAASTPVNITDVSNDTSGTITVARPAAFANKAFTTTVTITWNGAVVGTKTVKFKGEVAKIVATADYIAQAGATSAGVGSIAYEDSAGNVLLPTSGTASVSSTLNAYVQSATVTDWADSDDPYSYYDVACGGTAATGKDAGSATVEFQHVNASGTVIKSAPVKITCAGNVATYTGSFDKASYATGDIATLTITGKDYQGNLANAFDNIQSATSGSEFTITTPSNLTIVSAISSSSVKLTSGPGIKTYKFIVGTTEGSFQAIVSAPVVNVDLLGGANQTVAYKVANASTGVTNADVLKAIVSLIASINKQIAALQKALLKK